MRFIIFVIDDFKGSANPNEIEAIDAFNEALQANGHWVLAAGIGSPKTATLIDNRDGLDQAVASSIQLGPDSYSGFWLIEAANAEDARRLALAGSRACNRRVELRPFLGQ